MKRVCNILVFMCLSLFSVAQEETCVVDSIIQVMAKQEGYEKAETMQELARAFFDVSFDDCIEIGEKAIQESANVGDKPLLAQAYWKLGISYLEHYDLDLAQNYFDQGLEILKDTKDTELVMLILNYKGRVELLMGDMDMALFTYQRALQVSEKIGDELNCADVINNMAYVYFQQNDLDKAMEYFCNARYRYEQVSDTLSMAQCDNNISNIYVQRQHYDKAQTILRSAIPVFEYYNDEASLAVAYQNLGTIYAVGHVNMDSALFYLKKSMEYAVNLGDKVVLLEDEIETANVLSRLGRKKEAIDLYQSALYSSELMGYNKGILDAYRHLGIYYYETNDFNVSVSYLKKCLDLALEKGNQLYVNSVRPYLISDYAHLGHFTEMNKELGLYKEDFENIVSESNDLDEELIRLQDEAQGLLQQYDSQNKQIATLQTQRDQYRLAFFGLLAIAVFMVVLLVVYKIVRKKRAKV